MKIKLSSVLFLIILLCILSMFSSLVCVVDAAEIGDLENINKVVLHNDITVSVTLGLNDDPVYLYYEDGKPITLDWLSDNRDYRIYISSDNGNNRIKFPSLEPIFSGRPYSDRYISYTTFESLYTDSNREAGYLSAPLNFTTSKIADTSATFVVWLLKSNGTYVPDDTTESPDVDSPTDSDQGDSEDDGTTEENLNWFSSFIKEFFTSLFSPIISFFETIRDFFTRFSSVGDLWESLKGYTTLPVLEFFDSLNTGAIEILSEIWMFPIIKEFLIGVVAVLVIGGILKLFNSL